MDFPIPENKTWTIIDPTKLHDYSACPRAFFYRHILGWTSDAPSNHLVFGEAWHKAMEHLLIHGYGPNETDDAFIIMTDFYRLHFPEDTDELFAPKTPARAYEAINKYVEVYKDDLKEFEVLYTEIVGTVPIVPEENIVAHFKMDSILRHKAGYYFSLEHKTRGGAFSNQWLAQWPMSFQVGVYTHVLYCLYPPEEVRGIEINGIGFYKTKIELQRFPFWKTPRAMNAWFDSLVFWFDALRADMEALAIAKDSDPVMRAFAMNPNACSSYYGCPYLNFCETCPNPIQKYDEIPLGFKREFWDPSEIKATTEINLGEGGKSEHVNEQGRSKESPREAGLDVETEHPSRELSGPETNAGDEPTKGTFDFMLD